MIKYIKNSKSTYPTKTNTKGITINRHGQYVAKLSIRICDGHNKPKKTKNIIIGSYDTLREAKKKRINYILSLM